jgi:hypothetical protein
MVAFLEAYFDESYAAGGSQVLVVAGYLFEKDVARELDLKWKETLFRYKDLPYFHMVDCAHGNDPFDRLCRKECDAIAREMIALIRDHALFGVAVAVSERDYNELFPEGGWRPMGDVYSYSCWTALTAIYGWILKNQFDGEIAYFFEAGHRSQPKANAIMKNIFDSPNLRSDYRYAAHGFRAKQCLRLLQTADILAWQHFSDIKKIISGKARRKDFAALIEGQSLELKFIRREHLQVMRNQVDDFVAGRPLLTGSYGPFSPFVATWLKNHLT